MRLCIYRGTRGGAPASLSHFKDFVNTINLYSTLKALKISKINKVTVQKSYRL